MRSNRIASTNPLSFGVATNNNRTSTQGVAPITPQNRATITISNVIPANTPLTVPCQGNQFYVSAVSAPIQIRPHGGTYVKYSTGTGLDIPLENSFDRLDLKNENAFPIAFELVVGFDNFIDKRLIVSQQQQPAVLYPTYPVPSAANNVQINDLSGQEFVDINGVHWYALYRQEFVVYNTDTGVTLLLWKQGGNPTPPNNVAAGVIYPVTAIRFPFSGNFRLDLGGANINAVVSEVYSAIPKVVV